MDREFSYQVYFQMLVDGKFDFEESGSGGTAFLLKVRLDYNEHGDKRADDAEKKTKIDTVKRMLNMGGLTPEFIVQAVGITLEEVQALVNILEGKKGK